MGKMTFTNLSSIMNSGFEGFKTVAEMKSGGYLAVTFPLLGRFGDLRPLEYVRAGRTKVPVTSVTRWPVFISLPPDYGKSRFGVLREVQLAQFRQPS